MDLRKIMLFPARTGEEYVAWQLLGLGLSCAVPGYDRFAVRLTFRLLYPVAKVAGMTYEDWDEVAETVAVNTRENPIGHAGLALWDRLTTSRELPAGVTRECIEAIGSGCICPDAA